MSEPEGFLTRWSRRKLDPADKQTVEGAGAVPTNAEAKPQPSLGDTVPEFDVSKLPPLDSITATSDLTPFLQTGVPAALRHAALRRAWSADPTIRDFIGLNENLWDAAGIDIAPGFGPLDPSLDIKALTADLFDDNKAVSGCAAVDSAHAKSTSVNTPVQSLEDDMQERNVAVPNDVTSALRDGESSGPPEKQNEDNTVQVIKRRHGSAVPQ